MTHFKLNWQSRKPKMLPPRLKMTLIRVKSQVIIHIMPFLKLKVISRDIKKLFPKHQMMSRQLKNQS
mgnify:CR=1 FL=1